MILLHWRLLGEEKGLLARPAMIEKRIPLIRSHVTDVVGRDGAAHWQHVRPPLQRGAQHLIDIKGPSECLDCVNGDCRRGIMVQG